MVISKPICTDFTNDKLRHDGLRNLEISLKNL